RARPDADADHLRPPRWRDRSRRRQLRPSRRYEGHGRRAMNFGRIVSRQSRAVLLVIGLLSVTGIVALFRIPRALFPQTDFPRIVIVANNGVAPAQQTLVAVTRPIEEAMSGIPGIKRIKSVTARGSCESDLFFDWRTDIQQT